MDLAAPDAEISDPADGLEAVNTDCAEGQVDINTASAGDIGRILGVPSDPTVLRIIALRPWLKGTDLSSVPGIGPEVIPTLAPRVCASQPVLPPPTPLACEPGSQAVDLQTASASVISRRLRLPLETAEGIVAARPLPQDLHQVTTPRVPGLSEPKLAALLVDGQVCVRPAPLNAEGATFRWATASEGAVVSQGDYMLFIPPSRVTDPVGAYASVKPLPMIDGVRPAADFHIYGSWSSAAGPVVVGLPWPSGPGMDPVVFHDYSTADSRITSGQALWTGESPTGASIVRAALHSLSQVESGSVDCSGFASTLPVCGAEFSEKSLRDWTRELAQRDAASLPLGASPCPSAGNANAIGTIAAGLSCQLSRTSDTATWAIRNTTNEAIISLNLSQAMNAVQSFDSGPALPRLLNGVFELPGNPVLMPQETLRIPVARTDEANVHSFVNAAGSGLYNLSLALLAFLPPGVDMLVTKDLANVGAESLPDLIKTAAALWLDDCIKGGCADVRRVAGSSVFDKVAASSLKKALLLVELTVYTAAFLKAVQDQSDGTKTLILSYLNPPSPPDGVDVEQPVPPGADGTIAGFRPGTLYRIGTFDQSRSRTVYQLWELGRTAYGTFEEQEIACLSRSYPLRDYLAPTDVLSYWTTESSAALECPSGLPRIQLGPTATNWILRDSATGAAWFVDGSSRLGHIKDGNQYVACAQDYYVLDYAPVSMIEQFGLADPATAPRASCG